MKHPFSSFERATPKVAILLVIVVALVVLPSPGLSATILTVTSTADPGNGVCTVATTGDGCTLREAIAAANNTAGDDVIVFAAGVTGTIQLTSALPNFSSNITLQGPGANLLTVRRNTAGNCRIFNVTNGTASGPTISISGLTVADGLADGSTNSNTFAGGIYSENSTLTVTDCAFSDNHGNVGGGIVNLASNAGTTATLTVKNCTFSSNYSDNGGGAILNQGYSKGTATALVQNCTFSGNAGIQGAGIFNYGDGGAANLVVQHCTFSGNNTGNSVDAGGVSSVASDNGAHGSCATQIGNTIFQAGSGTNIGNAGFNNGVATMASLGYNLSDDNGSGFLTGAGDQPSVDPKLDPAGLRDNGGPTKTIALQSTSPAVNGGDPNFTPPPSFDQRGSGFNRVARGRLDSGAFELQDTPQTDTTLTVNTIADHDDGVCGTVDCTLREAIGAANAASGFPIIQFTSGLSGTITLTDGELAITHQLAVSGPGPRALAVDGNLSGRVFLIDAPGTFVSLSGLTLTRGEVAASGADSRGGGIYNTSTLTLTDCTISNNSAIGTGTQTTTYEGFGGAIYNDGNLTLVRCTVTGNLAQGGSPSTKNIPVAGNYALGGGVCNASTNSVMTFQDCTFTGNTAQGGSGGRNLFGGKGGDGGGGQGGAINAGYGSLTMINCTLTANKAQSGAAGSGSPAGDPGQSFGGGAEGNSLNATGQVGNTIIAGNTSSFVGPDVDGSFKSIGFNLVGNRTGDENSFAQPGDLTGTAAAPLDPKFGGFGNNGGPTDTVALLTGSPAINAGKDSIAPATDQRGASRVEVSDIGAYELGGAVPIPTPTPTPTTTPGLVGNVSTRLPVGTGDNVLIEGFIVQGPAGSTKKIIVRAIGPSLAPFGIPDALANPTLEIHDASANNATVATNDDWRNTQVGGLIAGDQSAEIAASGVAPSNDLESAIIANLAPGSYTAVVRGAGGGVGTGVVDAYDLSAASPAKLANIATRGLIQPGDKLMIAGFIIQNAPVQAVVRAIGPSLSAFGITNALPDTTLQLRDGNGVIVVENDDWKVRTNGSSQQAELEATGLQPTNDLEAAFVTTLQPGQYTAQVRGKPEQTGIGVVQVYFLQ